MQETPQAVKPVRGCTRSTQALERQTRAFVGSLVIAASALSFAYGPGWNLMTGFIGVGLIFAGISGLCPMANLIALMPWNRR